MAKIKAGMGEYQFYGQYQQAPVPMGGGMIKTHWIQRYTPANLPAKFDMVIQSWDTASKEHHFADYSVCVTLGMRNKKIYLLDVLRKRLDFPGLRKAAIALYHQYHPHTILIEDASSGIQLVQDLKEQQIHCVKPVRPDGDKITRVFAQASLFEAGRVLVPEQAPWLESFMHELTSFPTAKFDDQVDAVCQALTYVRDHLKEPGLLTYYRTLYEQQNKSST